MKEILKLRKEIEIQSKIYRKEWEKEKIDSEDIEEFGLNEFLRGKAEGFEESLELIDIIIKNQNDKKTKGK